MTTPTCAGPQLANLRSRSFEQLGRAWSAQPTIRRAWELRGEYMHACVRTRRLATSEKELETGNHEWVKDSRFARCDEERV